MSDCIKSFLMVSGFCLTFMGGGLTLLGFVLWVVCFGIVIIEVTK